MTSYTSTMTTKRKLCERQQFEHLRRYVFHVIRLLRDVYLIKKQKEKKRNLNVKKSIFTQQE